MRTHQLVAFNTAVESDNKIHDDDVARRFGFTGGLVPGVDVYAYLTWGPVSEWGRDWLERGTMDVRFGLPTYDGDAMTVEWDGSTARLRNSGGIEVSAGAATLPSGADTLPSGADLVVDPARFPLRALPTKEARPPAGAAVLAPGTVLGSWSATFHADVHRAYLDDVRETLTIYATDGIAHPGFLLRTANWILAENVVLGPWIHVGSRVSHLGLVNGGARVVTRGTVAAEYEKKGHRFVELDLLVTADDAPVAHIAHTAIYLPRQVAAG